MLREHFPILEQRVGKKPLVYLDNAATTQKPKMMIEALVNYYTTYNANVHRGVYGLANQATQALEDTREAVRQLIHAQHKEEIIFTSGTTATINLLALSLAKILPLQRGSEVLVTAWEHHSNLLPWQHFCQETGAILRVLPLSPTGALDIKSLPNYLNARTKILAVSHISNALGTIAPLEELIKQAHRYDTLVIIDAAQSVARLPIDVKKLDCDFLIFSAHKVYGPTGVGVLYGKKHHLENLPTLFSGGGTVRKVEWPEVCFEDLPYRLEAGTPNIAGIIAFKASLDFLKEAGWEKIYTHEKKLTLYLEQVLKGISGVKVLAPEVEKCGIVSFLLEDKHPLDVGMLLENYGILLRTGGHCAHPLMQYLGVEGTIRASLGLYNTEAEVDQLGQALEAIQQQ